MGKKKRKNAMDFINNDLFRSGGFYAHDIKKIENAITKFANKVASDRAYYKHFNSDALSFASGKWIMEMINEKGREDYLSFYLLNEITTAMLLHERRESAKERGDE